MSLYILKFGGTSLATVERIIHVANIISKLKKHKLIIVASAMHGVTNTLINYANSFHNNINSDYDSIVSCGELVSSGMLARALQSLNIKAKSLAGWQVPIKACGQHANATITDINTQILYELLNQDIVPVIAGFQGLSENNEILTLGRGGSDATACALAYYMQADECLIYTDVSGVYTADPRVVLRTQNLKTISYDEMLELSKFGAKVMQYQSVEIAKKYHVKVRVLSSFTDNSSTINTSINNTSTMSTSTIGTSTLICDETTYLNDYKIAGITHSNNFALLSINNISISNTNINNTVIDSFTNVIKLSEQTYLVPKAEISNINISSTVCNNITCSDITVGIVTIVGHNIPEFNVESKAVYYNELSTTYIVHLSQTDAILNTLHDFIFG